MYQDQPLARLQRSPELQAAQFAEVAAAPAGAIDQDLTGLVVLERTAAPAPQKGTKTRRAAKSGTAAAKTSSVAAKAGAVASKTSAATSKASAKA